MIDPLLVGPSYTSQSPNADPEMCMNWYPEQMESVGAKTRWALYPCPGFETFGSVAESPGRGVFATGTLTERLFSAVGFKLYEFDSAGTATSRGTIDSDDFPATFATSGTSGDQMVFTSGGTLYCYTLSTNSVSAISALSAVNLRQVVYLNNRFIALDAESSAFYWSALNDGSSWSTGSKAVRSTAADPWISMSVVLGQLWLLGTRTSDVYFPTEIATQPYAPIPGAYLEQGIVASFAAANLDSTLAWLGQNSNGKGVVWRSQGYAPQRISTHAVEFAIQNYETIDDAEAFAYQQEGHSFFVLSFPTADATWVYDTATGLWHERGYWDTDISDFLVYRPNSACQCFGMQIVGDRETGTLYTMSVSNYTDVDGANIRRVRRTPFVWDNNQLNRVFYQGLQLDMQTGIGLTAELTPPQVALNWSSDGQNYPDELTTDASAGPIGATGVRVLYTRLGSDRQRSWQVVCSDAVPWRLLQAVFRPDPIVGSS